MREAKETVHPRIRRTWAKDDMGAAGGSGCTSRTVPGRAGSEGAGVSGTKFSPGSVVATPGALEAFRASGEERLPFLGPWEGLIGIFPGAAAGSVQGVGEKS